jgi:hypothetical protein
MKTDPLSAVLGRLHARGFDPRQAGSGYSCRCPAHEDRSPSLSINVGDTGAVVMHCHAGCTLAAVLDALGLEPHDLFPDDGAGSATPAPRCAPPRSPKPIFPTAEAAVADFARSRGAPAGEWRYHAADGDLVGVVVRFNTATGKTFLPLRRTAAGSWVCEGMPAPRPLYRLPEVLATVDTIYVAEGEKAADALVSLGLVATTSPNGSKSAGKADWSPLAGRRVVIVPDHDGPGEAYADDVARLARAAGAESVVVVRLSDLWPGLPKGGDAHEWIEHHDAVDPDDLRAGIEALVAKAEPVAAADDDDADDEVLAWEDFPTSALPAPLAKFVIETARGIGCDESMVALPLLAALAGAVGNSRSVEGRPGHVEPAVLWCATVAESGAGKTPAFKAALTFTNAEQEVLFDAHRLELADHEGAMAEHDAAFTAWRRAAGKGNGGPPPERPVRPAAVRLVVNDTTVEALVPILGENPKGLLVAVDELAGLVASFDAYKPGGRGGADRSRWLSMHSAGPVTVDRKSSGTTFVKVAAVSVCGGVQPGTLARTMTPDNVDSGLLGRLLLAMPPRRERRWTIEPVGWQTTEDMKSIFRRLFDMAAPAGGPVVLDLDLDALERFKAFWLAHERETFTATGAVRSLLAKIEAAVLRLALVIHVTRQAAGEALPDRIDADTIGRAIVLGRWFACEGRRVYQLLLGGRAVDRTADDAEKAFRWIEQRGGFATVRDLRKGLRRFREDDDRAEQAARRLVAERRATWETPTAGGRPADGVRLAPKAR